LFEGGSFDVGNASAAAAAAATAVPSVAPAYFSHDEYCSEQLLRSH